MVKRNRRLSTLLDGLPLIALPSAAIFFWNHDWPRWTWMWTIAFALFGGLKWLSWRQATSRNCSTIRSIAYLIAWPGMNADAFLTQNAERQSSRWNLPIAIVNFVIGVTLLWLSTQVLQVNARGWMAMIGIIFVLHFGMFAILASIFQRFRIDAQPIMNFPVLSCSLAEFWGKRWNLAFRDLTHKFLFRPLAKHFNVRVAMFIGFLVSGLIHELAITIPGGGGYGGPTAYFLIQALGLNVERSKFGSTLGLRRGWAGWLFAMLVLVTPLTLLFPGIFIVNVILPFVDALGIGDI
ncbi:MAG: MBOAT family protein [Pirellulales bacterium]